MGNLTVRGIETAKPKDKAFKLMDGDGLQLRVAVDGTKTWLVRYFIDGAERQYRLPRPYGVTSSDGFCSLQDARDEASKIRALARTGIDYQIKLEAERQFEQLQRVAETKRLIDRAEAEKAESLTVRDLFEAWVPDTDRKDKGAEIRRLFQRDVLPEIGTKALKLLVEQDFRAILDKVVNRGSNRMAVMLLGDLKQMFRWAEKRKPWKKLIEDNPVELLEAQRITSDAYEGNERTHTLSVEDIKELAHKLPNAGLLKRTEIAMWIMLACCCRIGEIIQARWEHIDFDAKIWTIPKENAKNKMAHKVYLSSFALSYFNQLRELSGASEWCYPDATNTTHVCIKSTTKQIRDRQLTAQGRKAMSNRSKRCDALILTGGDWVPHDLRRTGSTMLQKLGVTPEIIERVLNHVEPDKLRRTYQTYDYADEKREAWRLLGDRLSLILNRADNVVMLRAG